MAAQKEQGSTKGRRNHFNGGIAPSERGTFTEAAHKHNEGVQQFASQVLASPGDYSPRMGKKAEFAKSMT